MYSNALLPCITKPTRVTPKTASLIDNIFCNGDIDDRRIFTGILYMDISDHFPIFYIDHDTKAKQKETFFTKRIYSQKSWIGLQRHYVTRTGLLYYPVKIPRGPIQSTPVISRLLGAKIRECEFSGSPVISRPRAKAPTREFRITDPHSLAFTTLKQYVER